MRGDAEESRSGLLPQVETTHLGKARTGLVVAPSLLPVLLLPVILLPVPLLAVSLLVRPGRRTGLLPVGRSSLVVLRGDDQDGRGHLFQGDHRPGTVVVFGRQPHPSVIQVVVLPIDEVVMWQVGRMVDGRPRNHNDGGRTPDVDTQAQAVRLDADTETVRPR